MAHYSRTNKLVKTNIFFSTISLVLLCVCGCTISPQKRSLNPIEQQEFASQLEGEIWRIEEVDGKLTLFLTKIEDDIDCYIAEINSFARGINSGMLGTTGVESREKPQNTKVTILFLNHDGHDLACITVNDATLQQESRFIGFVFSDNEEIVQPVNENAAYIFFRRTDNLNSFVKVVKIYDENKQVIFQRDKR